MSDEPRYANPDEQAAYETTWAAQLDRASDAAREFLAVLLEPLAAVIRRLGAWTLHP